MIRTRHTQFYGTWRRELIVWAVLVTSRRDGGLARIPLGEVDYEGVVAKR